MHPGTHLLLGWACAHVAPLERRDRLIVTIAGVIPDLDGLTLLAGKEAYQEYHHVFCHNVLFAALVAGVAIALGRKRLLAGLLTAASFHIHILGDLVGSGGPDGSVWTVPYLWPFSEKAYYAPWQWPLASWQNVTATIVLIAVALVIAVRCGRTPVEIFSLRADQAVVEAIRRRWPGK